MTEYKQEYLCEIAKPLPFLLQCAWNARGRPRVSFVYANKKGIEPMSVERCDLLTMKKAMGE